MDKEWHEKAGRQKKQKALKQNHDTKAQYVPNHSHKIPSDSKRVYGPIRVRFIRWWEMVAWRVVISQAVWHFFFPHKRKTLAHTNTTKMPITWIVAAPEESSTSSSPPQWDRSHFAAIMTPSPRATRRRTPLSSWGAVEMTSYRPDGMKTERADCNRLLNPNPLPRWAARGKRWKQTSFPHSP